MRGLPRWFYLLFGLALGAFALWFLLALWGRTAETYA